MKKIKLIKYNTLKKDLQEKYSYTEFEAKEAVRKIRKMDKELKKAFMDWYYYGIEPDLVIEGTTYQEVLKEINPQKIGAFLFLDYLKKEPSDAKKALFRGTDHIIITNEELDKIKRINNYVSPVVEEDTSDIVIEDENKNN